MVGRTPFFNADHTPNPASLDIKMCDNGIHVPDSRM